MKKYPDNNKFPLGIDVTIDDYFLPDIEFLKEIVRFLIVIPTTLFGLIWGLSLYLFAIFVGYSIVMYIFLWFGFLRELHQ